MNSPSAGSNPPQLNVKGLWRLPVGTALLILAILLLLAPGHLHPVDEVMRFYTAQSILFYQKTDIHECFGRFVGRGLNGAVKAPWFPGQPLTLIPFMLIGNQFPDASLYPVGAAGPLGWEEGPQGWLASYLNVLTLAITAGFLMHILLRFGLPSRVFFMRPKAEHHGFSRG